MPTWLRITILVVIYLIFLFVVCIATKIAIIDNEKQKEDEKRTKKAIIILVNGVFYILLAVAGELMLNVLLFPSYRFLSILKICLHAIYYFGFCFLIVGEINLKKKIKDVMRGILFLLGIVSFAFFVIAWVCSSADMYRYENSFWNPVELVETDHEEYTSVGPTLDIYSLDNEKEYHKSIGYNTNTGGYFYYYKAVNTGRICRTDISKDDIKSIDYISQYNDTRVVITKTTRIIKRTEFKRGSEKYQTEETVKNYNLYLNENQVVPVNE